MKNIYYKHALTVIFGFAVSAFSQNTFSGTAIEDLDHFFRDLKTLQADFSQVVLDENLSPLEESAGRLWILRPDQFRWDYHPPFAQQIIADGSNVWIYDVELEQATVREQYGALDGTPALLLSGRGDLELDYYIYDLGLQGPIAWVLLRPKVSSASFIEVQLGFQQNILRQIQLLDSMDHITRIVLTHVEENSTIPAKRFSFSPPAGVDVITGGL
jgi:outer membrane lipoprotein carrier protein